MVVFKLGNAGHHVVRVVDGEARGQERDVLSGLQGGATDIVKPFGLKELLARLDVALRQC